MEVVLRSIGRQVNCGDRSVLRVHAARESEGLLGSLMTRREGIITVQRGQGRPGGVWRGYQGQPA